MSVLLDLLSNIKHRSTNLNYFEVSGKTRTDKYRVVYTDFQRTRLEEEFQLNAFIAIPRKEELSRELHLTSRQV